MAVTYSLPPARNDPTPERAIAALSTTAACPLAVPIAAFLIAADEAGRVRNAAVKALVTWAREYVPEVSA